MATWLLRKERPSLRPGKRSAKLEKIERVPAVESRFGKPALRFVFAGIGNDEGGVAYLLTGCYPAEDNTLGKTIDKLVGRPVPVGEEVDLGEFVERKYALRMQESSDDDENGGSRVRIADFELLEEEEK